MKDESKEIKMFRLQALKSNTIPAKWCVVFSGKDESQLQFMTYSEENWTDGNPVSGNQVTLTTLAAIARTKDVTWVVCDGLYSWLCKQGLYDQIVCGAVSLPLGNASSNKGQLTGAFHCGNPTIIDVVVNGKRLHMIDFDNIGINDVKSLEEGVYRLRCYVRLVTAERLGSFQSTAAGQGAARYRTHDMGKHRIYCHQVPEVRQLERDAFYGGRAECKTLGCIKELTYHYDATSQHPTIGLSSTFPTKLVFYGQTDDMAMIGDLFGEGRQIIAKADIETETPDYPVRVKLPGKDQSPATIYPTGKFTTTLCSPELRHAFFNRRVRKIHLFAAYDCEPIFAENSEWFFAAKERVKEMDIGKVAGCLKLIQNCLYGHLGRRGRSWMDTQQCGICKGKKDVDGSPCIACDGKGFEPFPKWHDAEWGMWWGRHPDVGNVVPHRAIYGHHQHLDSGKEPETSCPAIAATMFSYSRIALLQSIEAVGWENTHYCDTDSVMVNERGRKKFYNRSGNWVVKEHCSDVDIRGIKYYRFGRRWVHAGVPAWAERHPDGSASFEKFEPFNYGMWHGKPFQHKMIMAQNDPHPVYRHGVVGSDGRVTPFRMDGMEIFTS